MSVKGKMTLLLTKALKFADDKSPAILTGVTCAGIVATAFAAYKAGPKIEKIKEAHKKAMDELNKDYGNDKVTDLEFRQEKRKINAETAKDLVPEVLPIIIFGGLSIGCAIGSNKISARRVAALSAAYEIASRSLSDYKEEIKKIVPKKADEIKEAVTKKRVQNEPIPDSDDYIYSTGRGDILCKDIYLKSFFRSSHEEIHRAINKVSAQVMHEGWVSVADLYYELGIKNFPPIARDIGWHDSDLIEGNLPVSTTTCWDDTGTIPVIGLDYEVDPFFRDGGRFRRY